MVDFQALHLDAGKIKTAVYSFPGSKIVSGPNSKGRFEEYEIQTCEKELVALLHVHPRGDGRITLQWKVGKNQPLSMKVAEHVVKHSSVVKHEAGPLGLSNITEEEWGFLLDSLKEEGMTLTHEPHQHADRYKVLAAGTDHVFIHRYNTGRFLMQGRAVNAYGKVVDSLSYVSDQKKEIIAAQLATVEVKDVSSDGLLAELEQRMPSACKILNDTVKCIFAPSLALTKLAIDLPDYSALTHPALRGLEACIKDLFLRHSISIQPKYGVGGQFSSSGTLIRAVKAQVGCLHTVGALESFYKIYHQHRNSLFHADSTTVTSRLLDKRQDAVDIVNSVLFTVEKGFEAIP
jgi:hypothetical protein